jgi:hypothetical protein
MELLKQINNNQPRHISTSINSKLDKRMSLLPKFQELQSQPEGKFSTVTQLTGKEYRQLTRVFLVAIVPLLIHHPYHLEAIQSGIDNILLACY